MSRSVRGNGLLMYSNAMTNVLAISYQYNSHESKGAPYQGAGACA